LIVFKEEGRGSNRFLSRLFAAEIVAEELPAVFVLVTIKAEIFPVGAVRGIIPGIAIFVMHR
jgi:hypothetical protein